MLHTFLKWQLLQGRVGLGLLAIALLVAALATGLDVAGVW